MVPVLRIQHIFSSDLDRMRPPSPFVLSERSESKDVFRTLQAPRNLRIAPFDSPLRGSLRANGNEGWAFATGGDREM
jgi:hypothetical protein